MHPPDQLTLDHPKERALVDGEISEALDALEVVRRYGAALRVAALDEADRVTRGLALARQLGGEQLFGMATVLPVAAPGLRLGPVPGPKVPLNPERLSPAAFARLWLEADINDVARFMRLFTELPLTDIGALMQRHSNQGRDVREVLGEAVADVLYGPTIGTMRLGHGCLSHPSEPVRRVA
jgi:tyrosyl-tRNA synthetase